MQSITRIAKISTLPSFKTTFVFRQAQFSMLLGQKSSTFGSSLISATISPWANQSRRAFSTMGSQMTYDKKNDYYDLLGIKTSSDPKQIKLAYYKMAKKYHPDTAGDDPKTVEKFKSISNAYETLVDESQRKLYDKLKMEASQTSAYSSNKGKSGGAYAGGYSSKKAKGQQSQDDFFYGDFKQKEDFYDFYSKFNQKGQRKDQDDFNQRQYTQNQNDFYGTGQNKKSQKKQQQRRSGSAYQQTEETFRPGGDPDDPFGGTTFHGKHERGFKASDHFEKWGQKSHTAEAAEDYSKQQYEDWMQRQQAMGKDQQSNFNTFKKTRHRVQTDKERRAEREEKYGKYKPGKDSAFHTRNRGFSQAVHSKWDWLWKSADYFKINRMNQKHEFHGRSNDLNNEFENAKGWFDSQTHESMTRKPLQTDDVKRMVNPKIVIGACLLISGAKKSVDAFVK